MSIDREKYMSVEEVKTLRTVTEARSIMDLRAGRINGVLAWMVVDIALSTGLRVSEIAALNVQDCDLKRGCLKVVRVKKRRRTQETLAVGKELVDHLKRFLTWRSARISSVARRYRKGLAATKGPLFVGSRGPLTTGGSRRSGIGPSNGRTCRRRFRFTRRDTRWLSICSSEPAIYDRSRSSWDTARRRPQRISTPTYRSRICRTA
jgi:integrase